MSCCNGDCVGSVSLATGPKGEQGDPGAAGGAGGLGPQGPQGPAGNQEMIIEASTVNVSTTQNTYQTAFSVPIDATALDFGDIDDTLRVEFDLVGDYLQEDDFAATITEVYHWKLSLGTTVIMDTSTSPYGFIFYLWAFQKYFKSAGTYQIDIVMSVDNTGAVPVYDCSYGLGDVAGATSSVFPSVNSIFGPQMVIKVDPLVFIDLSLGAQNLVLEIKTTDGTTNTINMTNFSVKKLIKV